MLIDCVGNPIKIDGNEVLRDLRVNVAENHQLRVKMNYLFAESEGVSSENPEHVVPVDIVVWNYSLPRLDKLSLGISINGKEMVRDLTFKVWLGFNFLDRKWTLRGNVGTTQIKKEMSTFLEIIQVVKEVVRPQVK